MKIHQLCAEEALQSLHSWPTGLSGAEAERRLREFGPNRVERVRGTPLCVRFLKGFTHFFALILWVAAGLAFLAEWQDPGAGMATLGFAILGVILVNGLFSFWQEYRAEQAMAALQKLLPHQVKVLRDGNVTQILAEELVPTILGDPVELALVRMARPILRVPVAYPRVDEVPFDSDRKRLSVLHCTPQGLILYTKGALEALLSLCRHVQLGGEVHPLEEDLRKEFLRAQDTLAAEGLRVLAVAYRAVPEGYDRDHLEEGLTLSGLVGLEDPPRPEVPGAVAMCGQAGIKVIMVTGDHPHTARASPGRLAFSRGTARRLLPESSYGGCPPHSCSWLWTCRTSCSPGLAPIRRCASSARSRPRGTSWP